METARDDAPLPPHVCARITPTAETGDQEELMHELLRLLSQTTADWQTLRHGRDSELSSNN